MRRTRTGPRLWGARVLIVCVTVAGMTTVATTSASARVKNPDILCRGHDGVGTVGNGWVVCGDGEMFDL